MAVIAIIGGKLQGVESLYLAKKAGMDSILIDKRETPPGKGLCGRFVQGDICRPDAKLLAALRGADLVLPALEGEEALLSLRAMADAHKLNIAFDFEANALSSSKLRSNALMSRLGIPMPEDPGLGEPPYMAKPSSSSGSQGIRYLKDKASLETFLRDTPDWDSWVLQSYASGRQFSMEVVGEPGNYRTFEITEIHVDEHFDCKRVTAPCGLSPERETALADIAKTLAEGMALRGLMDVEAIDHDGAWKVLEIDARMPSQTPAAVYQATGINLLAELAKLYGVGGGSTPWARRRFACYEHVVVKNGKIRVLGEHVMGSCGPLTLHFGLFGADEMLTDYRDGDTLVAIVINAADSEAALGEKRRRTLEAIDCAFGGGLQCVDAGPFG